MNNSGIKLVLGRIRKILWGKDLWIRRQVKRKEFKAGNPFASWTVCPDKISKGSIILSFGAGSDISWELEMVRKFDAEIFLFDPTPSSIKWIQSQNLPANIHFYPLGLSGKDGTIHFNLPEKAGYGSASEVGLSESRSGFDAEVKSFGSIVEMLAVKQVDILKMDVEGSEYPVIEGMEHWKIKPGQVLIEFHHRFPEVGVSKTRQAVAQMNAAGYRVFNVSATGEEISFILE